MQARLKKRKVDGGKEAIDPKVPRPTARKIHVFCPSQIVSETGVSERT